jgi:hypothetical protein
VQNRSASYLSKGQGAGLSSIKVSSSSSVMRRPDHARSRSGSPPIMWRSACSGAITAHRPFRQNLRSRPARVDEPTGFSLVTVVGRGGRQSRQPRDRASQSAKPCSKPTDIRVWIAQPRRAVISTVPAALAKARTEPMPHGAVQIAATPWPPSTAITAPVRYAPAGEASNSIAPSRSSVCPRRFSGMREISALPASV